MKVNIEERVQSARNYFLEGYNCSQAVLLAYHDITSLNKELAATIAAPFGGGMGRLREVCGAVSGMLMCVGFLYPNADPSSALAKKENYAAVQDVAEKFRQENGSIICRELLGLSCRKEEPTPSERTAEYYKKRPCVELVAIAARIVGEKINAMDKL